MSHTFLPVLPPEAASAGLALRPRGFDDEAFLRDLYVSTRWEELAGTGWPEAGKHAFLHQQFAFQTRHYEAHYPGAAWGIVECWGEPAGRLLLQRSGVDPEGDLGVEDDLAAKEDLRVIDVALLPAHRGRGIGGTLMRAVQAQAQALGATTVSLHVERGGRALGLYRRLSFAPAEERGLHVLLVWPVPPAPVR